MTLYLQRHRSNAWRWISQGYAHAWSHCGFQVKFIDSFEEVNTKEQYGLMIADFWLHHEYEDYINVIDYIKKSEFCVMFASAKGLPHPWGGHPNFTCPFHDEFIGDLNGIENLIKWSFCETDNEYFSHWKNIKTVPLAFDSVSYQCDRNEQQDYLYDVCFVGGVANNGFNEKIQIMKSCLDTFIASGLTCGFSVGQNISHEKENETLTRSKVCLNIHDKYQRVLGLDTNERTFKSLGSNGLLISDAPAQLKKLFPEVFCSNNPEELVAECKRLLSKDVDELNDIKKKNRKIINEEHSYIKMVEQLLSYAN